MSDMIASKDHISPYIVCLKSQTANAFFLLQESSCAKLELACTGLREQLDVARYVLSVLCA